MPYPFHLPTTSTLPLPSCLTSPTHPSLPLTASSRRSLLRAALKRHRRLKDPAQKAADLPELVEAVNGYLGYLFALESGVGGSGSSGEGIEVRVKREIEVEWRTTLSTPPSSLSGALGRRKKSDKKKSKDDDNDESNSNSDTNTPDGKPSTSVRGRVPLHSLPAETTFTCLLLGLLHSLLARSSLRTLHDKSSTTGAPTASTRTTAVAAGMRHFLTAHSIFSYLASRPAHTAPANPPPDISAPVLRALAELCMAEATLSAVIKDDAHAAAAAQERHDTDDTWMYAAPSIPKVRAHLFARLCMAAAEHAGRGVGLLLEAEASSSGVPGGSGKLDPELLRYMRDLRRTARAKACRFLGVDREGEGATAEGIAWLRAAWVELGFEEDGVEVEGEGKRGLGFSRLKSKVKEGREDRRIAGGGEWGGDAGRLEERRVVKGLLAKWEKLNNAISPHPIPPHTNLPSTLPSGRAYHTQPPTFHPPTLSPSELQKMRAPASPRMESAGVGGDGRGYAGRGAGGGSDSSSDASLDDAHAGSGAQRLEGRGAAAAVPGAFPSDAAGRGEGARGASGGGVGPYC